MAFIVPTGWTRVQGFPEIQGNDAGATLVDQFKASYDLTDIYIKLPPSGSAYDQESITEDLADLRLANYTISPTASKNHAIISLTYQPSDSPVATEESIAEFFLENGTLEKALETHRDSEGVIDYRTKWNYHLAKKDGTSESQPSGWEDATDTKLTETEWIWAKEPSELAEGWVIVEAKTKAGVESYIVPSPVVQERKHYKSKKSANTAGNSVGTIETPANVFGKTGGEWLVVSASVQKDGRRYLIERSFQYADSWDGDLYS